MERGRKREGRDERGEIKLIGERRRRRAKRRRSYEVKEERRISP